MEKAAWKINDLRRFTVQSDQLWACWLMLLTRRKDMRKDARKAVFGGERHQAVEKFFRFVNKDGARTRQGAREARGSKEVQLELFTLPR